MVWRGAIVFFWWFDRIGIAQGALLCFVQVVPKYRSRFAVEVGLLQSLTDEIVHSGATFSGAVVRWIKQHPEREQAKRLLGPDMTLLERCRKRLEEAWYLWHSTRTGDEALDSITWRLTQVPAS